MDEAFIILGFVLECMVRKYSNMVACGEIIFTIFQLYKVVEFKQTILR